MAPTFNSCCCCVPLKVGAHIIGVINCLCFMFGIAFFIIYFINPEIAPGLPYYCILISFLPICLAYIHMCKDPTFERKMRFANVFLWIGLLSNVVVWYAAYLGYTIRNSF